MDTKLNINIKGKQLTDATGMPDAELMRISDKMTDLAADVMSKQETMGYALKHIVDNFSADDCRILTAMFLAAGMSGHLTPSDDDLNT